MPWQAWDRTFLHTFCAARLPARYSPFHLHCILVLHPTKHFFSWTAVGQALSPFPLPLPSHPSYTTTHLPHTHQAAFLLLLGTPAYDMTTFAVQIDRHFDMLYTCLQQSFACLPAYIALAFSRFCYTISRLKHFLCLPCNSSFSGTMPSFLPPPLALLCLIDTIILLSLPFMGWDFACPHCLRQTSLCLAGWAHLLRTVLCSTTLYAGCQTLREGEPAGLR